MEFSNKPSSQQPQLYAGKRAAIYIRVSTDKQEEGYSFEFQEEKALAWIEEHGCTLDRKHIWYDTHTGMDVFERPGLIAMRHTARRREFDVLVMYKLDRFSRVDWQQEMVREELKQYRVTTVTLKRDEHADDDTPLGRVIRAFYGFKAEEERNDILQRNKDGLERKLKNGYLLGAGRATYGYQWNAKGKERTHYVIDTEKTAVVQRIFDMYVYQRYSFRRIAKTLTDEGIPTPFGSQDQWNLSTLKKILSNVNYIGKAVFRRTHIINEPGRKKQQVRTPEAEQVALPEGIIPPIIDIQTFEKAQQLLRRNKEQAARNNKHPEDTLLRCGLAICGYCNTHMRVMRSHGYLYYRCCQRDNLGIACETSEISAKLLDALVWERAVEIIRNPAQATAKVEQRRREDPTKDRRTAIKRQLAQVAHEIENCTKTHNESKNETVRGIMLRELERLAKTQEELQRMQHAAQNWQEEWLKEQEKLDSFVQQCAKMRGQLDDPNFVPTYAFKREACEYFGLKALVWRPGHKPHWQIEGDPPAIENTSSLRSNP